MIDQHTLTATLPGIALGVRAGSVTLDEAWSPYVQASLECALPANIDGIDPRQLTRVAVTANQAFIDPPRPSVARAFDLVLRRRHVDRTAQTMTLELASDEALLQDYAWTGGAPRAPLTADLRTHVGQVLAIAVPGAVLQADAGDTAPLDAKAGIWEPGTYAWDHLAPLVEQPGLRLWSDGAGGWHLTARQPSVPGAVQLSYLYTITTAAEDITREDTWCDAVVIIYRWTDAAGAQQIAYDISAPAGFTKVRTIIYETAPPGAGAAAQVRKRMRGRGREHTIAAISDYSVKPGMGAMLTVPGTLTQTGFVSAVSWAWPDAEMNVTTRELVDTPTTAWVFDPPGIAWNAIPVGVDWSEDI